MYSASGKAAVYDLSMFDESVVKRTEQKTVKTATSYNPFDLTKIVTFVVILATLAAILLSYAQLNEISDEVTQLKGQLVTLQEDAKRMSVNLEEKTSLKKVDEYARTVLGMTDASSAQMQYMTINNQDKVSVYDNTKGMNLMAISDNVIKSFNAVLEYLK